MNSKLNAEYRKPLPGTKLDYFDTRAAVDAIQPGAYDKLPYSLRVFAENLVRRCDPAQLNACLTQIIERKQDLDFPWFPARVVCHDILGQTALVDLAGLRPRLEKASATQQPVFHRGSAKTPLRKEGDGRTSTPTMDVTHTHSG